MLGTLKRLFRKDADNSTLKDPAEWLAEALLGGSRTASGVQVTSLKAMGVPTVFACVNRIAGTVASIPLNLYRRLPHGKELAVNHPLHYLMHDSPNSEMTSVDLRHTMQSTLSLRNNACALLVRDGMGDLVEVKPIEPCDITWERDESKQLIYRVEGNVVPSSRILHLHGLSQNGVCGLDTVGTAREVIALAIALQDNAARFFGNGSRPGVILEHPNTLTDGVAKRIRESFESIYRGNQNAYRTAVLEEGMKVARSRSENKDSQFLESRRYQDNQICQVFGVPPHKVAILDRATFSNIEQQNIEYVQDTILPQLRIWEQNLNRKLLTPEQRRLYFFEFNVDGLLRGDTKTRYESYNLAITSGWMNRNEVREKENMNRVEGLDEFLTPVAVAQPSSNDKSDNDDAQHATANDDTDDAEE